jgi:acyl-CoA thioester hydrolase
VWNSPIVCPDQVIEPDWIDYNGHLNMAFYNVLFDRGVDHVYDLLGIGVDYVRAGNGSCFTLEVHVNYLHELTIDDPVRVTFQLVDRDAKRLHFFQTMEHARTGELKATSEQLALHVDMVSRRSSPFPASTVEKIADLETAHGNLTQPDQLGRVIGIRRKPN